MGKVVGIDLGTTFSTIAYINKEGIPCIINNNEGSRTTPSVILFDEEEVIVGEVAKDSTILEGYNIVQAIKNEMGNECYHYQNNRGEKYSPEELSALILKKLRKDSECFLGEKVSSCVITVPAYFTDAQRQATQDAGRIAGMNVKKIINEPTAAAIAFAHNTQMEKGNILVYDLGGGTFDVSIIAYDRAHVIVKATDGIRKLGGHFFDKELVEFVAEYLEEHHEIDLYDDCYMDELQYINGKIEECKVHLSTKNETFLPIKIGKVKKRLLLTREMFEDRIEKYYNRTEFVVKDTLKAAQMTWNDIDKIVLVGGSTRIPLIRKRLENLTHKTLSYEVNPDEAVAIGAAILGKTLEDKEPVDKVNPEKKIIDVCSHSIGIITLNPRTGGYINSIIIQRNTRLPAQCKQVFYTSDENQEVITLRVTEGEYEEVEDITIIGSFEIDLPYGLSKGTRVELEMRIDDEQLISIYTRIESVADFFRELHLNRKANLTEDQIEKKKDLIAQLDVS